MIYLDYVTSSPMSGEVLDSLIRVSNEYPALPGTGNLLAIEASKLLNNATKQISSILKVKESEIIYTSGNTETNNLALIGSALALGKKGSRIITSKLESESIYGICNFLEQQGFIVDYVNNNEEGVIDFEDLKNKISKDTILISITSVNESMGIRQPLKIIRQIINRENSKIIFHSDMTDAIGKITVSLAELDLATISTSKMHGPTGIGILYKKDNVFLKPLLYSNNNSIRPDFNSLPLITALSKSLRIACTDIEKKSEKVAKYNRKIITMLEKYPKILINQTKYSLPYILNISVLDFKPETIRSSLEHHNIYINGINSYLDPTIYNIYQDKKRSISTLKISFSYITTNEEISTFIDTFEMIYNKLQGGE